MDTLFNAGKTGKSLTWPRPSYDGKYIMVTLMDYGYFSIWHKESDLWLIDVGTGETIPLEKANSDDADSYHNWSTGSHWFVFTSRRENGLYSFLDLSCVDDSWKRPSHFCCRKRSPKDITPEPFTHSIRRISPRARWIWMLVWLRWPLKAGNG